MSSVLRSLRDRHRRVRQGDERGTSLVELVVAMTIMVICGAIFTAAVVTLYSATNRAQAVTNSSTQTNQAYQALDKLVRYSAAISTPGFGVGVGSAKYWYVELRDTTSGTEQCVQLRLQTTSQQLQRRGWSAASPSTTLTAWVPIASGVTTATAADGSIIQPFLGASSATANHQQLSITLVAISGPASSPVKSKSSVRFTALNSIEPPAVGSICQQAGRP